jgi:drug/metabolite transporter (DMT)-like permease
VALGLVCYGLSSILVRLAGPVEPLAIALWRTTFVTLLLAPAALVRARGEIARMPPKSWALIGASGVALGLHFATWIASVSLTSVAAASVLVTTTPLWIAGLGLAGVGARPTGRTLAAVGVGVVGAALIGLGGSVGVPPPSPGVGNALALGAAVLVSGYYLAGQRVRQGASFLAYFAPVNAVAAVTILVICLWLDVPMGLSREALLWCFAMAVGPGLVGHGSFAVALGYLPASTLSLLGLAEPVIASALAVLLFAEVPSVVALGGMTLVLVSIAAVVRGRG